MEAAAIVRAARRRSGCSQRAFASRLEVAASTVGNWESGLSAPSFATVTGLLAHVDLGLSLCAVPPEPTPELRAHLHLSLTARLRLALGEVSSPYSRAAGPAWLELLTLSRRGTVAVHPPVASGVWIPVAPSRHVSVTVHQPREELPSCAAVDVVTSSADPSPSLVPVCLSGPLRVWVLPPAELLLDDAARLRQAAYLLHTGAARDDAARRGPAHRDPDEWDEAGRLLRTKGSELLEPPMPELSRAWRLGGSVSLAQAVRTRPR